MHTDWEKAALGSCQVWSISTNLSIVYNEITILNQTHGTSNFNFIGLLLAEITKPSKVKAAWNFKLGQKYFFEMLCTKYDNHFRPNTDLPQLSHKVCQ